MAMVAISIRASTASVVSKINAGSIAAVPWTVINTAMIAVATDSIVRIC